MENLKKFLFVASLCLGLVSLLLSMFSVSSLLGDDSYSSEKSEVKLEGEALYVFGNKDQEVGFHITGSSANGLWASSTGAILTFDHPDVAKISLFGPKKKAWEGVLKSNSGFGRSLDIHTHFTVPAITESTLVGKITGSITIPVVEKRGFWDRTLDLEIPVLLEVISQQEAEERQRATQSRQWKELFRGLVVLLVSGTFLICRGAENEGHKFRTWQVMLYCASGIGVSLLSVFSAWLWIESGRLGVTIPKLLEILDL